jgi:3-oxoacyl-[acyl-carrier-protein] synthase-3
MEAFSPLHFQITATGLYAPPSVETAEDLAKRVGKTAEWIVESTGVSRRHISDEPVEHMAAEAARQALGSGPPPDLILNASATPRQVIPDTSVFIESELGFDGVASHTIHGTCLSFLVALHTAGAFVAARAYKRVLVVSSEIGSVARDYTEPESSVLLGDGAAAAIIEPTPPGQGSKLLAYVAATYPRFAGFAELRGGGVHRLPNGPASLPTDTLFHMNGTRLFRAAMINIPPMIERLLSQAGLKIEDIDLVVPHQPSKPGLELLQRWGFPPDKVVDIIAEYGNCIAASMPMALATAHADGRLRRGARVLLIGTGAGLSIGSAILEF